MTVWIYLHTFILTFHQISAIANSYTTGITIYHISSQQPASQQKYTEKNTDNNHSKLKRALFLHHDGSEPFLSEKLTTE